MRLKSIYSIFLISMFIAIGVYLLLCFCIYENIYFEADRHLWYRRIPIAIGEFLLFIPHSIKSLLPKLGFSSTVSGNVISVYLILQNVGLATLAFMLCWIPSGEKRAERIDQVGCCCSLFSQDDFNQAGVRGGQFRKGRPAQINLASLVDQSFGRTTIGNLDHHTPTGMGDHDPAAERV